VDSATTVLGGNGAPEPDDDGVSDESPLAAAVVSSAVLLRVRLAAIVDITNKVIVE
jgi:hypothetical protein